MSITTKPYAAFGYIILKNDMNAGHLLNDEIFKDGYIEIRDSKPNDLGRYGDIKGGYAWLYTKGGIRWSDVYGDSPTVVRRAGWSNITESLDPGLYRNEIIENTTVFCIGPILNSDKIPKVPKVSVFNLKAGEQTLLTVGTNLFLAEGTMTTGTTNLTGPTQVSVRSSDSSVTATTDCYGIIFP